MRQYLSELPAKPSSFEMDLRLARNDLLETYPASAVVRFPDLNWYWEVGIRLNVGRAVHS
jgi:hypothetical protein